MFTTLLSAKSEAKEAECDGPERVGRTLKLGVSLIVCLRYIICLETSLEQQRICAVHLPALSRAVLPHCLQSEVTLRPNALSWPGVCGTNSCSNHVKCFEPQICSFRYHLHRSNREIRVGLSAVCCKEKARLPFSLRRILTDEKGSTPTR
jgi:hypothetical protein